jgi:hypothetical protein
MKKLIVLAVLLYANSLWALPASGQVAQHAAHYWRDHAEQKTYTSPTNQQADAARKREKFAQQTAKQRAAQPMVRRELRQQQRSERPAR